MADQSTVDAFLPELNDLMRAATQANLAAQTGGSDGDQRQAWSNVTRLSTLITNAEDEALAADDSSLASLNSDLATATSNIEALLSSAGQLSQAINTTADTITKIKTALGL